MALPKIRELMRFILEISQDGMMRSTKDLCSELERKLNLSSDEIVEILPSGRLTVFRKRVELAKAALKTAGFIESPVHAAVKITGAGKKALVENHASVVLRKSGNNDGNEITRIPWNDQEAALLLLALIDVLQNKIDRKAAVRAVSKALRQYAVQKGMSIDDKFRNENGIDLMMRNLEYVFTGGVSGLPVKTGWFFRIVDIYKNHPEQFKELCNGTSSISNNTLSDDKLDEATHAFVNRFSSIEGMGEHLKDKDTFLETGAYLEENSDSKSSIVLTQATDDAVSLVLKQHYKFGFIFNPIEFQRFRIFASEKGLSLPENDEVLKTVIISSGMLICKRVYYRDDRMLEELYKIVETVFSSGVSVIYYESLFEREQTWMESHFITSSDLLKGYLLHTNISECSAFSKKFIIKGRKLSEKEAVTLELRRIWGDCPVRSVFSLHESLPYIPLDSIRRVLSGNDSFVLVSKEKRVSGSKYLLIDRLDITEDRSKEIIDFVDEKCSVKNCVSLAEIPLGNLEEEYDLKEWTIRVAIFKKILLGKYHLNGQILTMKKQPDESALTLLKQWIKGKNSCTFNEAMDKLTELTGKKNRQYAFRALYDEMVRVSVDLFVADKTVNFRKDEIDSKLDLFMSGHHFRSVLDLTTFTNFPRCERNWNHYLLESYCHRFSGKYRLRLISFNNKNVGIIAENDFNKTYDEMLAIALTKTKDKLSPEKAGEYLFNKGYLTKKRYVNMGKIIQQALTIHTKE